MCGLAGTGPVLVGGIALWSAKVPDSNRVFAALILGFGVLCIACAIAIWLGKRKGLLIAAGLFLVDAIFAVAVGGDGLQEVIAGVGPLAASAFCFSLYRSSSDTDPNDGR